MATIGAEIAHLAPGEVDLRMPFSAGLTAAARLHHAGIVGTLAASACGYAAYTLMPADAAVSRRVQAEPDHPAAGDASRPRGRVTKSGRTLSFVTPRSRGREGEER